MSQQNIVITVIVFIIIVLGGWWLISANSAAAPASTQSGEQATSTDTGATSTTSTGTQATTLHALVAQGGNYTCDIETIQGGTHTTGTVYGSGGKTRLDLIAAQNGLDTRAHIIRSGTTSYTWVDGQPTGIKAAITASSPITQPSGGVISVDENVNLSSSCRPWVPDASQFVPPTGITFTSQ